MTENPSNGRTFVRARFLPVTKSQGLPRAIIVNSLDGVKHRYSAIPCYIIMGRLAGRPGFKKPPRSREESGRGLLSPILPRNIPPSALLRPSLRA